MKVVLQDGIKDCGICCLLSIIRHYGGDSSKEYLRQITNTSKNGVTAYNLIDASTILGFQSYALNGLIEDIDLSKLPCIAHVIINKSYQHFVVIYKIDFKNKKILVMDPAKGKRILNLGEFKLMSSGNYIFLIPNKKLPVFIKNKEITESIFKFFIVNKKSFSVILYLTITYFIFHILSAFHFKYLMMFAIEYKISNNIKFICIIVGFLFLFKEISLLLRNILLLKYSELLDYKVTLKTYKQIILLPYLYYKNRTTGEILSRIKDLSFIKDYYLRIFTVFSTDTLSVIIFIILLFNINSDLTLITITLFLILIFLNFVFKNKIKDTLKIYHHREDKLNSYLIETFSSMEVIKGMHTEKLITDRLKIKYKSFLDSIYKVSFIQEIFSFVSKNINNIFQIILLGFGSYEVIENNLTLSGLLVYQSVFSFLNYSLNNIINLIHDFPNYKLAKERVEDLFNIRKEKFLNAASFIGTSLNGTIKYNNLSYSYNNKNILTNINLEINKNDKILFLGPSGSGKSTLVKLLMRYLDIDFGMISINGIDINHYNLDILRKSITYVSQQEFLFSDTIYNNITLYRDISKEKVNEIMKLTLVDKFININSISYNQMVEENGFNFSGGERQRIILARSILKNSDIYIFDEALSQIDIKNTKIILNNIFNYLKDKIVIVISHRYNNKELFNRIIKLKNGKIYEEKL